MSYGIIGGSKLCVWRNNFAVFTRKFEQNIFISLEVQSIRRIGCDTYVILLVAYVLKHRLCIMHLLENFKL